MKKLSKSPLFTLNNVHYLCTDNYYMSTHVKDFPEKLIPIQDLQDLIKSFDNQHQDQDEQLQDQYEFDLNKLFEEQELIQEILKKFPNDQQ